MKKLDSFSTAAEAVDYIVSLGLVNARRDGYKYLQAHLPKESYYQQKILKYLQTEYPEGKGFFWKAAAGAYCRQGIPDICGVIRGHYFGFEVKRPYIGKLSAIQERTIKQINAAGGTAGVVTFPEDAERIIAGYLFV